MHIPFCARRCGYCDFNTYTAQELGQGANQADYARTLGKEIQLCSQYLHKLSPLRTVFFGGGTPTVLPPADLAFILSTLRQVFGLEPGAEVTTEANPDSLHDGDLAELAAAGFTRVSLGMQSAAAHVLKVLDRTHSHKDLERAVKEAHRVGLRTSVDLIYATPGESLDDWRRSLQTAVDLGVNHISAYSLVIEPGTKMGRQLRAGKIEPVQNDDEALKYEVADQLLSSAGLQWYEISNWARPGFECAHNLAYWQGQDWWGFGPGAHSHLSKAFESVLKEAEKTLGIKDGETDYRKHQAIRWWNVKHPRVYAQMLEKHQLPIAGFEKIDSDTAHFERIMLLLRLRSGLPLSELSDEGRAKIDTLAKRGLVEIKSVPPKKYLPGQEKGEEKTLMLTRKGRLLADQIVIELSE